MGQRKSPAYRAQGPIVTAVTENAIWHLSFAEYLDRSLALRGPSLASDRSDAKVPADRPMSSAALPSWRQNTPTLRGFLGLNQAAPVRLSPEDPAGRELIEDSLTLQAADRIADRSATHPELSRENRLGNPRPDGKSPAKQLSADVFVGGLAYRRDHFINVSVACEFSVNTGRF